MKFFKKLFIKDYEKTSDPEVRFRYGIVAGIFGIVSNVVLCVLKIVVGVISGSVSIIADAVNNLSDAGGSVVTLVGFKLSSRPADKEHPYGHARFEYIAGLLISVIVLIIGVLLCKSGVEKIISPSDVSVGVVTYVVLGIAVTGKILQGLLYRDFGKSINSDTLLANAADSRNDVVSTAAVLISTIIIHTTGCNIDGYMCVLVSAFIIVSSVKMFKDIVSPLIGDAPDKAFVDKIASKIMSYDVVCGFHDLMIHSYGPAICFASMHVEVDASSDIVAVHDCIDNIERDFMNDMNVHMVIHMDPVAVNDPETVGFKEKVVKIISDYDKNLTIHDFRLVKGDTHTNVLFDVVIPHKSKATADAIRRLLDERIDDGKQYYYVITVDRSYVL